MESEKIPESFEHEVESLLSQGQIYEDVNEFALNISKMINTNKTKALNLLFSMVKLARSKFESKDASVLKMVKPWLQKLSKAFDTYNLRHHFPSGKQKVEPNHGKKRDHDGNFKGNATAGQNNETKCGDGNKNQTIIAENGIKTNQSIDIKQDPDSSLPVSDVDSSKASTESFTIASKPLPETDQNKTASPGSEVKLEVHDNPSSSMSSSNGGLSSVPLTSSTDLVSDSNNLYQTVPDNQSKQADQESNVRPTADCKELNYSQDKEPFMDKCISDLKTQQVNSNTTNSLEIKQEKHEPKESENVLKAQITCSANEEDRTIKATVNDTSCDKQENRNKSQTSQSVKASAPTGISEEKLKQTLKHVSKVRYHIQNWQRSNRRKRESICFDVRCVDSYLGLKTHAYLRHIPEVFDARFLNPSDALQKLRVSALTWLTMRFLGRQGTLQNLVDFVNSQHCLNATDQIAPSTSQWNLLDSFCCYLRLPVPMVFTASPLNSIAGLLNWKVLLLLSAMLHKDDMLTWRKKFQRPAHDVLQYTTVDNHFHPQGFDQGNSLSRSPEDVVTFKDQKNLGIRLVGVVATFSDPDDYPTYGNLTALPQEVVAVVGIHPKYASRSRRYLEKALHKLSSLLTCTCVTAIGDIGLDFTVDPNHWPAQIKLLQNVLTLVSPNMTIQICCKGSTPDNHTEAHLLLLQLLKGVPRDQRVHFTSFMGSSTVVEWWKHAFPSISFGFNRNIANFNADQIAVLRDLNPRQILLESNAHYPCPSIMDIQAPRELFEIADLMASIRGERREEVLSRSRTASVRLYGRNSLNNCGY
mgnify:CR=1 FL=1